MTLAIDVKQALAVPEPLKGKLGKLTRRPKPDVPANDDPRKELDLLVKQHMAMTKKAVALQAMHKDRVSQRTGELLPSFVPEDVAAELDLVAKAMNRKASKLEAAMLRQLKQIPVYTQFLANVFGVGPVVSAYLVSQIDIAKTEKPSSLRRFCGLAVINGRLERRSKGARNAYNGQIRTRLYQAFTTMWMAGTRYGATSKYLEIWRNYKHRMAHSERLLDENKILKGDGEAYFGAKAFIHSTGWHKAADVFIEDLYIVWRTLEGLPVWPSYYAAKLGYAHGGKVCVNAPKLMTIAEALEVVGDVGGSRATARVEDAEGCEKG